MGSPPWPLPLMVPGPPPVPRSDVAPKAPPRIFELTADQARAWSSDDDVERGFMRAQVRDVCRKRLAANPTLAGIEVVDSEGRRLERVERKKTRRAPKR